MNTNAMQAADLYCGAGGLSEGLKQACAQLGRRLDLVAVNHWTVAIDTHSANHPEARHYCTSVEGVNPLDIVPGGFLEFLCAGVECTYHSNARGGGQLNEQSRSSAWDLLRWAEKLTINNILIENVPEFVKWGPLFEDCNCGAGVDAAKHERACHYKRPIPAREGEYFRNFVRNLRVLGYIVDWRILRAADFGDPTTRKRFFLQAKKKRPGMRPAITWPEPTHYPRESLHLTGNGEVWRPAREIIDWSIPGHSIYLSPEEARKLKIRRPLAANTVRRIYAGLEKFCGIPFVIGAGGPEGSGHPHSVEEPLGTLLTENHRGLVTPSLSPYLVILRNHADAQSLSEPAPTVCAEGQHLGLATPYVVQLAHSTEGDNRRCFSLDRPVATLTTRRSMGLAQPFMIQIAHSGNSPQQCCFTVERPLNTLTTKAEFGLVYPFVLGQQSGATARSVEQPLPTAATAGAISLISPAPMPFLTKYHGSHAGKEDGASRVISLDDTLPTVDCSNRLSLVLPFLTSYYGNGQAHSTNEPLPTITTHDKFGLVESRLREAGALQEGDQLFWLDILFRMLQPHELAGAHSYPRSYRFTGSKDDQVAQIGNSVPIKMATALCTEMLREPNTRRQRKAKVAA